MIPSQAIHLREVCSLLAQKIHAVCSGSAVEQYRTTRNFYSKVPCTKVCTTSSVDHPFFSNCLQTDRRDLARAQSVCAKRGLLGGGATMERAIKRALGACCALAL